ncbi:MAG: hypothetical protein R2736_09070 [Solirubrobacterales bacterium]
MSATDATVAAIDTTDGAGPLQKASVSLKGAHIGLQERIDEFDRVVRETGHL